MSISLEQQRSEYSQRRFLAMPLAGTIVWGLLVLTGVWLSPELAALCIFMGTGCIVYLGLYISKYTGENFLDKTQPSNAFDGLFYLTVLQALLVFSIGIPFYLVEESSLPLSVGILTGLMWVPLSWVIGHWVGLFHGLVRTVVIVLVWYVFPDDRFISIPLVIVAIYLATILILEKRWRSLS